jgi:thymidylate synthase
VVFVFTVIKVKQQNKKAMLYKPANTLVAANFSDDYFFLHNFLYTEGDNVSSRNGNTKELLNFKTTLTKPGNRCVAGYKRNTNIFFLLAEAMWIFNGRRDLELLEIFNSGMKAFSDDGKFFNAPYGFRIRKYGINALQEFDEASRIVMEASKDQLAISLDMLHNDPTDRRVVINIWNPELDLNKKSVDIPCNDMLMFKIRNNKLHQTIQNRSNDLNWGLTTNVFQFSFIGEIMSALLGIEYGTQTHNSQSLHLYMQQELTTSLQSEFMLGDYETFAKGGITYFYLYEHFQALPIDFKFPETNLPVRKKLFWVDFYLHGIILKLLTRNRTKFEGVQMVEEAAFEKELKEFSFYFWYVYQLLKVYVSYKQHKEHGIAIDNLIALITETGTGKIDITLMALNFFMRRVLDKDKINYQSTLEKLVYYVSSFKNIPVGKL